MFELQAAKLPTSSEDLAQAVKTAETSVTSAGWALEKTVESPLRGNAGAVEYFIRATLVRPC
jgi:predicted rRNA methylase YqxC with S4 and FtsJ domains